VTTLRLRIVSVLLVTLGLTSGAARAQEGYKPTAGEIPPPKTAPPVVTAAPGSPPSDAVVLLDGKSVDKWQSVKGGPARWKVEDGAMVVVAGTGDVATKEAFGDVQLHIEWATPAEVAGEGQGRGNSGVFLQDRYEVQVLDSYQNNTYYHGQAAAVYKQHAPLVNASRKSGEWQVYDIVFRAPKFDASGKLATPGRVTVFHNGVLVQDHVEIKGTTTHEGGPGHEVHGPGPVRLQDHGNPVRYRNIWIRKLSS
jgi:hypothetical protein